MKNNNLPTINPSIEMSSREISHLIDSRHSDLMRSIDRLSAKGVISKYTPMAHTHESNKQRYFCYMVSKRDTYVIVAQNSPEFTAKLVDRWQELENNAPMQVDKLPDHAKEIEAAQKNLQVLLKKQELSEAYNSLSVDRFDVSNEEALESSENFFARRYLAKSKQKNLHTAARNIIRLTNNPFAAYKGRGESLNKALDALERVSK